MHNRRSILGSVATTLIAAICCRRAKAMDAKDQPVFLHIYSSNRFASFDQDKQNRRKTRSTSSEWVRVVTLLVTPNAPVFIRLPGAHDPDITIDGKFERRDGNELHTLLKIAWSDSYITEQHELSGLVVGNEIHRSSTIHCRYIFSHLKDPYDVLDRVMDK